jgi:DNA-binding transcriptional MocR family regulator
MTTPANPRIDDLLSTRARIGWGASAPPARPVADAAFEFGGGHPDPSSFPYEGMVEATADVMKADGAAAFSYGEAQGYKGLRELVAHKYRLFENLEVSPDNVIVSNGSGHALSLAFSAFVDPGDAILSEAPTFSGTLATIRRHGARVLDVPLDAEGMDTTVAHQQLELLRREGKPCKLIYTIVNFQKPGGADHVAPPSRGLIALAHEYETVILDTTPTATRFEGQAHPRSTPSTRGTMRAGTLSKILGRGAAGLALATQGDDPRLQGFLRRGVNPYVSRVATAYMVTTWCPMNRSWTSTAPSATRC